MAAHASEVFPFCLLSQAVWAVCPDRNIGSIQGSDNLHNVISQLSMLWGKRGISLVASNQNGEVTLTASLLRPRLTRHPDTSFTAALDQLTPAIL